jgi:23S rRNA (guanine1835-N2)-methyltransferase
MASEIPQLASPFGEFKLQRYPARRNESLLAWCAADVLLLEAYAGQQREGSVLVANDENGALATSLPAATSWTDSALAAIALQHNLASNGKTAVTQL